MVKRKDKKKANAQVAADNEYYAERGETTAVENSKRMVIIKAKFNKLSTANQKFVRRITEEYKTKKLRKLTENVSKAKLLLIVCILTVVPFLLFGGKLIRNFNNAKKELSKFGSNYIRKSDFDDLLRMAYYDKWKFPHQGELRAKIGEGEY